MRNSLALTMVFAACSGTTGGALVSFSASATGVGDGSPLAFVTATGASLTLTRAVLHVGAVYLNQSVPTSGSAPESCLSQGLYVGQVFGPLDANLLDAAPQAFPSEGEGSTLTARTAEVWLSGADLDAAADPTLILAVDGTAQLDGGVRDFSARVTIGANRLPTVSDPSLPSARPICRQRIVSPLQVNLAPSPGGTLTLHLDPRRLFDAVDFSTLDAGPDGTLVLPDDETGAGAGLFRGLHSSAVYQLTWSAAP